MKPITGLDCGSFQHFPGRDYEFDLLTSSGVESYQVVEWQLADQLSVRFICSLSNFLVHQQS